MAGIQGSPREPRGFSLAYWFPARQNAGTVAHHNELAMKVFWAWQSDLPGKTGRHFIKEALNEAIDRINESREIEEPDEELQSGMHLDHDRKGLSGSPDLLANEILKKIDASTVFAGQGCSVLNDHLGC